MEYSIGVYATLYILLVICLIFPPTELISAGLTIENLFGRLLWDEHRYFTEHHIRRISLNMFAHSLLPFLFFAWIEWYDTSTSFFTLAVPSGLPLMWHILFIGSVILPITIATMIWYWHQHDYERHPLVHQLSRYDPDWRRVAATIDNEYRRIDKFSVNLSGVSRVIVTDSWIVVITVYAVHVCQQADARVTVLQVYWQGVHDADALYNHSVMFQADQHAISPHSESGAQFLTISVENLSKPILPFTLRLNAFDYRDLRQKLQQPIQKTRDVLIQASLSERFVQAFIDSALTNDRAVLNDDTHASLEPCIGCMHETANVKLVKNCVDLDRRQVDEMGNTVMHCVDCFCRPMWCVACMARWFASRQDQRRPENWLGGKSPCPTCRATFCILDVRMVEGLEPTVLRSAD